MNSNARVATDCRERQARLYDQHNGLSFEVIASCFAKLEPMFGICTHASSRRKKSFCRLLTYVCLIKGLACGERQDEGDGGAPQVVKLSEQLQTLNFEHIGADALRSVAISTLSPVSHLTI